MSEDSVPDTLGLGVTRPATGGATGPLRSVGGYEILGRLGEGGMGTVFRARQPGLGREVALKVLVTGSLASEDGKERFRRESLVLAALDHTGIVPVCEAGERDGLAFLAMKWMRGGTMADRAASYRDQPRLAAEHFARIADAVEHAHSRGVLHRDLKPANVLFDEAGTPHVADFGLAKLLDESSSGRLTQSGALVGSIPYMSPEQASGEPLGRATDVFSLGVMLYEALTGRLPFHAPSPLAALRATIEQPPVRPRDHAPGLARDLEAICLKCLEKSPARRYASAADLAIDLRRWLAGERVTAGAGGRTLRAAAILLAGLITLFGALWFADGHLGMWKMIRISTAPRGVSRAWLPLLYVAMLSVILLLIALVYRLDRLLGRSRFLAEHPGIGAVWIAIGATLAVAVVGLVAYLLAAGIS
ncbi:MAG: serine/threonine-protein kinase [Gemmataceae bacterium]